MLMFKYSLVRAQVGQEQSWVAIAGTQGELKKISIALRQLEQSILADQTISEQCRQHTRRTHHLRYVYVLSGFHGLRRYNGGVNGLSVKLQHGVLRKDAVSTMLKRLKQVAVVSSTKSSPA